MSSSSSMAMVSLVVLVIQNSSLVLMTRYSRFSLPASETYYTSTLILNQEIVKMLLCLVMFYFEKPHATAPSTPLFLSSSSPGGAAGGSGSTPLTIDSMHHEKGYLSRLKETVFQRSTLKLFLPAALFTLQNFLIFVALSHLDAMTFQVLSQTKLLSAAVFSVLLLDRKLNGWQWFSLVLLTAGVYYSQTDSQKESFLKSPTSSSSALTFLPSTVTKRSGGVERDAQNPFFGAVACIVSGLSSSFAGVYFEKVVKTTPPSLAIRNIHLGMFGIPLAVLSMLVIDVLPSWTGSQPPFRYWRGYNGLTVMLVFVHALGGLLVAVVVKYADNILKGFATGVAIIVSGLYGWLFWEYHPTGLFVGGCVLVTLSTMLYHYKDQGNATSRLLQAARSDDKEQV